MNTQRDTHILDVFVAPSNQRKSKKEWRNVFPAKSVVYASPLWDNPKCTLTKRTKLWTKVKTLNKYTGLHTYQLHVRYTKVFD